MNSRGFTKVSGFVQCISYLDPMEHSKQTRGTDGNMPDEPNPDALPKMASCAEKGRSRDLGPICRVLRASSRWSMLFPKSIGKKEDSGMHISST